MDHSTKVQEVIPNLFREQYAKMTAVLCRHFGLVHIELAEDIVSDTFLKATERWTIEGIPQYPEAWLYTVAKNKTKDYFKHQAVFDQKVKSEISQHTDQEDLPIELDSTVSTDSQLAMIFAICDPIIPTEGQLCLALQILCGFSIDEISNALLTKKETIKKRLFRAKEQLRASNFEIKALLPTQINQRLPQVHKTLYLFFNEGYFSTNHDQVIRKELCYEALRLTVMLTANDRTNTAETNALLALLCYQSSRLDARVNHQGELVLFDQQKTADWDTALIDKGNYYLVQATNQEETSKYHLEAAIAYWHTTQNPAKWTSILDLYNQLILVEYSPITALNRTFAFAQVYGFEAGIKEAEKLNLLHNRFYFELLGYLYTPVHPQKAIHFFQQALALTQSPAEQNILHKKIAELTTKQNEK